MTNEKYLDGIKSTGFELEFLISKSLMKEGWTVINNKYYIDDVQGSAREIDILGYKVTLKNDIQVYTVLIISCKKNSDNTWALLSKSKNDKDPNIDWNPVTLWSNHKILKLIIENYKWKKEYINSSKSLYNELFSPEKHIFAFQELNNNSGKPKNDRAIFNSIVTAMKSQDYEIGSLNKRKKEKSIYNFNLISVVDAPLLRINYGEKTPDAEEIESDIYVGSYIINKKETISRVHFIKSNAFDVCLSTYNKLHSHNIDQSVTIHNSYFIDCLKDKRKIELFKKEFNNSLRFDIYKVLRELRHPERVDFKNVIVSWDKNKNCATIEVDDVFEDNEIKALNLNIEIKASVGAALKKHYQYEGNFYFDSEIPF